MDTSRWQAVSALIDPVRRALYDYVRAQHRPVTREAAADAQRISRSLAAHHLDKLVEAGLLHARYQWPPGQPRGPGRTPKTYEPTGDDVTLTVPERRYDLAGQILADAIAAAPHDSRAAACEIARQTGRHIGGQTGATPDPDGATQVLGELGFAPSRPEPSRVVLGNCPFHALARRQPDLVCALNLALISGLLDGMRACDLTARLAPGHGACCVEVRRAT